jgi:hypothetical protein
LFVLVQAITRDGSNLVGGSAENKLIEMRKVDKRMETNTDGSFFQEGDRVRVKRTGETGSVNAIDGGVVYVLMDETDEAALFSAYIDEDAYIELIPAEGRETGSQENAGAKKLYR